MDYANGFPEAPHFHSKVDQILIFQEGWFKLTCTMSLKPLKNEWAGAKSVVTIGHIGLSSTKL